MRIQSFILSQHFIVNININIIKKIKFVLKKMALFSNNEKVNNKVKLVKMK